MQGSQSRTASRCSNIPALCITAGNSSRPTSSTHTITHLQYCSNVVSAGKESRVEPRYCSWHLLPWAAQPCHHDACRKNERPPALCSVHAPRLLGIMSHCHSQPQQQQAQQ